MSAKNQNSGGAKTREEMKKVKSEQQKQGQPGEKRKRIRVRLIPIWLRIVLVLVLIIISSAAGAMVGYGVLGGGKPTDVFNKSTWTHIGDLVNREK
jgi:hypothetical protein